MLIIFIIAILAIMLYIAYEIASWETHIEMNIQYEGNNGIQYKCTYRQFLELWDRYKNDDRLCISNKYAAIYDYSYNPHRLELYIWADIIIFNYTSYTMKLLDWIRVKHWINKNLV